MKHIKNCKLAKGMILHSADYPKSLLFSRHWLWAAQSVCMCYCLYVCVCIGMKVGVHRSRLNMGRSSPAKWAITHINTIKKHFTIWCFQSTTRDNISNWQQNCLDAISVCTSTGWGRGCGLLSVSVSLCLSAHVALFAVSPALWQYGCNFLGEGGVFPICSLSWIAYISRCTYSLCFRWNTAVYQEQNTVNTVGCEHLVKKD